jgi:hypothetical protein
MEYVDNLFLFKYILLMVLFQIYRHASLHERCEASNSCQVFPINNVMHV